MKRIVILILFLVIFMTGCSYEITAKNRQVLLGENEDWKVEYQFNFITTYPREDGELYAHSSVQKNLIVTYQKDLSNLSEVKNLKIDYQDSFGGGGHITEEFDSPPGKKQFRFGGGSSSTSDLGSYLQERTNLSQAIRIYSGPSYEMRTKSNATVTIQVDGKTDTIQLEPAKAPSPLPSLAEEMNSRITKQPFLRFFSGHASDLLLKLEDIKIRIAVDGTVSDSVDTAKDGAKGQELVPPVLYYEFIIRNEGRKQIIGNPDDLEVRIVPSDHLKAVSQETVGVNLFDPDSGYGWGQSITGSIFNRNQDCNFTLSFDLSNESPQSMMDPLSDEKVKNLLGSASDATLIILYKEEEAARFDLNHVER